MRHRCGALKNLRVLEISKTLDFIGADFRDLLLAKKLSALFALVNASVMFACVTLSLLANKTEATAAVKNRSLKNDFLSSPRPKWVGAQTALLIPIKKPPVKGGFFYWCRQRDLNSRPTDYKSVALPTELCRR